MGNINSGSAEDNEVLGDSIEASESTHASSGSCEIVRDSESVRASDFSPADLDNTTGIARLGMPQAVQSSSSLEIQACAEAERINIDARKRLDKDDSTGCYPDIRGKAATLFQGLDLNCLSFQQFQDLGNKLTGVIANNDSRRWSKKGCKSNLYISA